MVGKGNLAVFESSNISETRMATPIKIDVHAWTIVHGRKGKFGRF